MIQVTKTYLPEKDEYLKYLDGIWEKNYVTNNGPLVQQLEKELADYLCVKHLVYVANGTIAIQIALRALKVQGEISYAFLG